MPDSPDVDQIAHQFVTTWVRGWMPDAQVAALTTRLAEEFRQIWNARGAVDLAKVEHELSTLTGSTATGPCVKSLDRALKTLDK
jgi:hypothetical protein